MLKSYARVIQQGIPKFRESRTDDSVSMVLQKRLLTVGRIRDIYNLSTLTPRDWPKFSRY